MISLKLTELEGGYFVPELNGHPVCTYTRHNMQYFLPPSLPLKGMGVGTGEGRIYTSKLQKSTHKLQKSTYKYWLATKKKSCGQF